MSFAKWWPFCSGFNSFKYKSIKFICHKSIKFICHNITPLQKAANESVPAESLTIKPGLLRRLTNVQTAWNWQIQIFLAEVVHWVDVVTRLERLMLGSSWMIVLLVLKLEYSGEVGQCHGCWCPGDLRRQVINNHDIDHVGWMGLWLPRWKIWTTCVITVVRDCRKYKYFCIFDNKCNVPRVTFASQWQNRYAFWNRKIINAINISIGSIKGCQNESYLSPQ